MTTHPPFELTPLILRLCQAIGHELGMLEGAHLSPVPVKLRKDNKIKTIQSTLAIEGNTLSIDQITGIIEGKRVVGSTREIQEVRNAVQVYTLINQLNPLSITSFKKTHGLLMHELISDPGKLRTTGVGIYKGKDITHVAPPAKRLPELMENLFNFIKAKNGIPWLIKACVFHYELEFIHPFADGNGRMGRLWQQLILIKENRLFEFISVESLIKEHQNEYYSVLEACDAVANSTKFIEFSLLQIVNALKTYSNSITSNIMDARSRLEYSHEKFQGLWFTRKDYLLFHKNISSATASRDLQKGVASGLLYIQGERNQIKYRFI